MFFVGETSQGTGTLDPAKALDPIMQQQKSQDDAGEMSQGTGTLDPAKAPLWYLEQASQLQLNFESDLSKVIIFQRQCKYLVEYLGMAIKSNWKSFNLPLFPEHERECLGALKLVYQLAKEVGSFVCECCNEKTWMEVALTSATVPKRVSSWQWHLKVCRELLYNSNKLGATWLTIAQDRGLEEEEWLAMKKMALDDECDLMRLLESMLDPSNKSKSNALIRNKELISMLLERLKAHHATSTMDPSQVSSWKDINGMRLWEVGFEALLLADEVESLGVGQMVSKRELIGAIKVAIKEYHSSYDTMRITVDRLSHPNIVSFLGYIDGERLHSKILELMDGDLRTLVVQRMQEDSNREGPFSIWEACDIMLQVALGVWYMHQNRVLHGDLKSANILVRRFKDNTLEYICAKVSDLDFAKRIEKSITSSVQTLNVRTNRWWAPELVHDEGLKISKTTREMLKHPFKTDVYSFGITCFEILTGELPFASLDSVEAVKKKVLEGVRPTLPRNSPQSLRNLIQLCWDPDPKVRPSFAEICKELWYIKCSLLLEPQGHTSQLPLPVLEPISLPPQVLKYKEEYSSLKVMRKLGSGGSDMVTVFLSTMLLQPENKVAQKRFMGLHNKCFKNEVSIMAELEHSNVVRLLYYASDKRSCSIVMELMDGDLNDLMDRRRLRGQVTPTGPFSLADALHVILQIAQGMEYVHWKNVVHRDLKSCNILIKNASEGEKLEVKVADFGLSMKLKSRHSLLSNEESRVGTIRWMAPEVTSEPASESLLMYDPFKSDVFNFGMLCYEILVGRVPFSEVEDLDKVRKNMLDGGRPTLPEWTPSYLKVLIKKCWVKDASERPTFKDIVGKLTKVRVETS